MKVLIACEESQTICKAFRDRGIEAYSCDLKKCSGNHPEWHFQMDMFDAVKIAKWDLVIAHPPCTFLSCSGNRWLYDEVHYPNRMKDRQDAINFFLHVANLNVDRLVIENPIGCMSSIYRKPDQIIQPWMFGDPYQKTTCLWIKGLPLLKPTNIVSPGDFIITKSGKKMPKWYSDLAKLPPEERRTARSKTFPGIATAMAVQWGDYIKEITDEF